MRFQKPCIECSKRQGLRIFNIAMDGQGKQNQNDTLDTLKHELETKIDSVDPSMSPAELSLIAIRAAQKHADSFDPFAEIKRANNEMALKLYPSLKEHVERSDDPIHTACQLAACGNIIDMGIHEKFDIDATINKVLNEGFKQNQFNQFRSELEEELNHRNNLELLYLCDNAGEIVFDKLFMEELIKHYPALNITAIVRSIPVLNDATLDDAKLVGLDQVVNVLENGNDQLGTIIERASPEVIDKYEHANIILSKGQANYETVSHADPRVYFILKAKCEVIANSLRVNLWDAVMTKMAPEEVTKKGEGELRVLT